MLTIYRGIHLKSLAETLLDTFRACPSENPLAPELFVVQNYGMARWLSLYIAEEEGIAANLQFKFPAEVYWQIMRVMDSDIPEQLSSERIPMSWAIFQILQNDRDLSLSQLSRYVEHRDPQKQEVRCWDLACRIADVFDQYLTYRPDMLLGWENGNYSTGANSERWQAALWQKLSKRWKQGGREGMHRAGLHQKLTEKIEAGNVAYNKLPHRITVFGVSEMPEAYIEMLVMLSGVIDVNFFIIDANKNEADPLIESLGKVGHDFQFLIDKHIKIHRDTLKVAGKKLDGELPDAPNFFGTIKQILISKSESVKSASYDRSVQIHSCHSPRREVEVLYDQLLHMLDENESLDPNDILVLCPQIEVYAPEIEAIFGVVEEAVPPIPYHLAEKGATANMVNLAFRKLLELVSSRFKVTDTLDFLDSGPVRAAFSFGKDDIHTIEKWIDDTNVRWGMDAGHKASLGLPASDSFTWRSGLRRMMAGYAMQSTEDALFRQIYPYSEIRQTGDAQLLGRFSRLMNQLFECRQQTQESRTLHEWSELFGQWLTVLFSEDETYFADLQKLRNIVQSLGKQGELAGMHKQVSYRVVRKFLEDQLDRQGTGGGRPGKGVTFSGMVPMRNIPAKAVCVIGMNEGVFPRGKDRVEFNLIASFPREGDRQPGKEDRQIFLESILAAQQQIYFSYVGQSNKKEADFPPSVVLREFMDYVDNSFGIDLDEKVQKHKLQCFSSFYFDKSIGTHLGSYSSQSRKIAHRLSGSNQHDIDFMEYDLPEPEESYRQLTVQKIVSFFQHPAKFLLQQRLRLYLHEDHVPDEDRETFNLDGLQRYHVGQEMLNRYFDEQASLSSFQQVASARNLLPEGWPGDQAFDEMARKVEVFAEPVQQELEEDQLEPIEIDLKLGNFQIAGNLDQIYSRRQLLFRFGRLRPKDIIELWIRHLLFQEVKPDSHPGVSRLYTHHKRKGTAFVQLTPLDNHRDLIQNLLKIYWSGLQRNTWFYPNASFAYAEKVIYKQKSEEEGLKAAEREWVDWYNDYPKEGDDPYNKILTNSGNPFEHSALVNIFEQVSKYFWSPFFTSLDESEEGDL